MTIADEKAAARKAARARRDTASPSDAAAANRALAGLIKTLPGSVVAGYWPIRSEIDPRPAMQALSATHDICLPVVGGHSDPLSFRRWTPDCEMEEGAFGAAIPRDPIEMTPNILIVPLLAFDAAGYRLGYGGGFYDRTLAELRPEGPVEAVGFAYDIQRTARVPREETDERLDFVVTEAGVLKF